MSDAPPVPERWNVVVTTREGGQRHLRRAVSRLVRLRRCPYRNVLVGEVPDLPAFLDGLARRVEEQPLIAEWLGKVLPVERTFVVDVPRFVEQVQGECGDMLDRIAGRRFHVRVERRGHKGVISTHAAEQALGAYVFETLAARGSPATVAFADPDVVLVVELLGPIAGLGLVTRELRERYPFVHID